MGRPGGPWRRNTHCSLRNSTFSCPWIPIFMAQNPGLRGRGVGPCGSQASGDDRRQLGGVTLSLPSHRLAPRPWGLPGLKNATASVENAKGTQEAPARLEGAGRRQVRGQASAPVRVTHKAQGPFPNRQWRETRSRWSARGQVVVASKRKASGRSA